MPSVLLWDTLLNPIVLEKIEMYCEIEFILHNTPFQEAGQCLQYAYSSRLETDNTAEVVCAKLKNFVECFSKINNPACFVADIVREYYILYATDPKWTDILININMCGNDSKQDLAEIGCLYMKPLYFAQYCGIMELDDCQ